MVGAVAQHVVVEAHPESQAADLRLDQPWPALQQWLEEQAAAMPAMSLKDHGHTPYPVMLFAAMQNWRQGHGGSLPGNYKEKRALKEKMMEGMRKKEVAVKIATKKKVLSQGPSVRLFKTL